MAFFLVTHSSVVEADDEADAARKVINDIRAGGSVRVTVKSDEMTINSVTVAPKERQKLSVEMSDGRDDDGFKPSGVEKGSVHKPDYPGDRSSAVRSAVTVAVLAALSLTLGYIQFHG